jgi:hypothetical protein
LTDRQQKVYRLQEKKVQIVDRWAADRKVRNSDRQKI